MDRRAEWTTAALGVVMLAVVAPIGLASGEAADQAAQALGVRRPFGLHTPVADILARCAVMLPLGEAGARPHAVGALAAAVALALLVARLRLTPARLPGPGAAIAVAAGVAVVALSRPFIEVACLRPALATDFALFVAAATLLEILRRDSSRSSAGLGAAFLSGLAAGTGWSVRAAVWPPAFAMTLWALRRGRRWPLLAPFLFVAGTGVVFGSMAAARPAPSNTWVTLLQGIVVPPAPGRIELATAVGALRGAAGDGGILVALVALLGWSVLFMRARAETLLSVFVAGCATAAALATGEPLFARLLVMAMLTAPVAAAVDVLTRSFGRARAAAAVVTAVIVVLPPALVGVGRALDAPARRGPTAVSRRLDVAVAAQEASPLSVPVSDPEAERWWRYGRAVGLNASTLP